MNKYKQQQDMLNKANPKQINEIRYILDFGANQINVRISNN